MSSPKEICNFYDQLKSKRANADSTVQEIIDYMFPFAPDVTNTRTAGQKKTGKIFDSTAPYGLHVFSQFVQGSIINAGQLWFALAHRDPEKNKKPENAGWCDNTRARALREMRPVFYGPAGQAINSWAAFGNGPLLMETVPQKREGLKRLRYTSVPWGQYVMCEGLDGRNDQFIRSLKLPAQQIVKKFPNGNLSDDITKAAKKEPLKEFEILHSIMPRDYQDYSKSAIKTNKEFAFASCWIEKEKPGLKPIEEGGYRKFPVAIARYDLISGETYARGPGEMALADTRTLNLADQKALLKWDRELDPPTVTKANSLVSKILDKRAGGNTMVKQDPRNAIVPMFEGSNWMAHDTMAERKEQAILRVFHVNEILNLLAREKPEMTAFEVNARLTLLQQILGPVFGILEAEFLSQIVEVTLDNMAYANMLEDPPEDFAVGDGKDLIDIIYEGPLARAQKNGEIMAIQQSIADTAGIQPFFPEVVKLVDWQNVTRNLWDMRGTQDMLVDEETFKKNVEKMYAQANAEKAANLMAGAAEAAGKVAPFLKVANEEAQGGRQAA